MDILIGILEQGFIYAIMAMGVYITYKILDFPDLSVDGTFPLGGAVCALLLSNGINPWVSLLAAFVAGAAAGFLTGVIHVKCKVRDLLSGIITMTILYSLNLHIAGSANVPIMQYDNIFSSDISFLGDLKKTAIIFIIMIIAKIVLDLYLKTKSGCLLRAVGDNPNVVVSLAKNSGTVKIVGLVIANALVSLAGAVMCQQQRTFDISIGTGTVVIGLASVIIGTNIFGKMGFFKATTAVIIGSVLYKACVAAAIAAGLSPSDMKLVTGVLFLLILIIGNISGVTAAFRSWLCNFKKGGGKNARNEKNQ